MGIGIDGTKHPLAVVEGSTENATLVTDLLVGLRDRGLDVTRPLLVVIDGSKALSRAGGVFDHPVIPRCQLHKIRNVGVKLPEELRATVAKRMRAAYHGQCPRRPGGAGEPGPGPGQVPPRGRRFSYAKGWPRLSPSCAWA